MFMIDQQVVQIIERVNEMNDVELYSLGIWRVHKVQILLRSFNMDNEINF